MNIKLFLTLYSMSVPVFVAIDMLWLGFIVKDFYRNRIGDLMGHINWIAAVMFYLVFLAGLTIFATYPAVVKESVVTGAIWGSVFGFFTYATYDLTNLATLRGWSLSVALVDMVWGAVLGGVVAALTTMVYLWLF